VGTHWELGDPLRELKGNIVGTHEEPREK